MSGKGSGVEWSVQYWLVASHYSGGEGSAI